MDPIDQKIDPVNGIEPFRISMPKTTAEFLNTEQGANLLAKTKAFISPDMSLDAIRQTILQMSPEELKQYTEATDKAVNPVLNAIEKPYVPAIKETIIDPITGGLKGIYYGTAQAGGFLGEKMANFIESVSKNNLANYGYDPKTGKTVELPPDQRPGAGMEIANFIRYHAKGAQQYSMDQLNNADQISTGVGRMIGHSAGTILDAMLFSRLTGGMVTGMAASSGAQSIHKLETDPGQFAYDVSIGAALGVTLKGANMLSPMPRFAALFGVGTGQSYFAGNDVGQSILDGIAFGSIGLLGGPKGLTIDQAARLRKEPSEYKMVKEYNQRLEELKKNGGEMTKYTEEPEISNFIKEKAANVRHQEMNTTEDVWKKYQEIAEEYKNFDESRRMGDAGYNKTNERAKLLIESGIPEEIIRKWEQGHVVNAEQYVALRAMNKAYMDEFDAAVKAWEANKNHETGLRVIQASQRFVDSFEVLTSVKSEIARTLNVMKTQATDGPEFYEQMKQILNSQGGLDGLDQRIQLIKTAKMPGEKANGIRAMTKAGPMDAFISYWFDGILSGHRTQIVNIGGNISSLTIDMYDNFMGAIVGKGKEIAAKATGKEPPKNKIYFGELVEKARLGGFFEGLKIAGKTAWEAFKENKPQKTAAEAANERIQQEKNPGAKVIEDPSGRTQKNEAQMISHGAENIPTKTLRNIFTFSGRQLVTADEFFKVIARRMDLAQKASHDAIMKGLKGDEYKEFVRKRMESPTYDEALKADAYAKKMTFQKDLGYIGSTIESLMNRPGAIPRSLRFVIPFIRTPSNLMKFSFEHIPVLQNFVTDFRKELQSEDPAVRDLAHGKMITGMSVMGSVLWATHNGMITGNGPTDPRQRAVLKANGWEPNAIRNPITGKWITGLNRLDPLGSMIFMTADAYEIFTGKYSNETKNSVGMALLGSFVNNVKNKSYLQGAMKFSDLLDNQDPTTPKKWATFMQDFAFSFAPKSSFVRQANDIADPYQRYITGQMNAQGFQEKFMSNVPFLSNKLYAKYNLLGDPIKKTSRYLGGFMPYGETAYKNNKILNELQRLEIFPSYIPKKIAGVELTPAQYADYTKMAGKLFKQYAGAVVKSDDYDSAHDGVKAQALDAALRNSRGEALMMLYVRNPKLQEEVNRSKIKKKFRIDIGAPAGPDAIDRSGKFQVPQLPADFNPNGF